MIALDFFPLAEFGAPYAARHLLYPHDTTETFDAVASAVVVIVMFVFAADAGMHGLNVWSGNCPMQSMPCNRPRSP